MNADQTAAMLHNIRSIHSKVHETADEFIQERAITDENMKLLIRLAMLKSSGIVMEALRLSLADVRIN